MELENKEKGIKQSERRSGKILRQIISSRNLKSCYEKFPDKIYWTREGRTQKIKNQKSIIDYIIEGRNNNTEIEDFEVDEDDSYTLRGGKNANGRKTDHNTITFKIKNSTHIMNNRAVKIKITKRNYDIKKLNQDMSTIKYCKNLNEKENYERWLNKAQDFLKEYTKETKTEER